MTYIVGSHWFICDVCGQKYRSTEKKKRWDGLIVCPADNEADHPQKYIRVESDGQAVPDPRPRPEDVFTLPVYCTPVTRTAAADDGTADCMTVDYRLNINYRDYGAYQPIVAPTSTPTPILLDTFTAANGTNPTTRDMDAHPAGAARWTINRFGDNVGVIQDNKWKLKDFVSGAWVPAAIQYTLPGTAPVLNYSGGTAALLMKCLPPTIGVVRLYAFNYDLTAAAQIQWANDVVWGQFYDETPSGGGRLDYSLAQSPQTLRSLVVWTDGTDIKLIVDGAEVLSLTSPLASFQLNYIDLGIQSILDTSGTAYIDTAGIYQGLTLAEAIALTT